MIGPTTSLTRTADIHVLDVRCSCPAGTVEDETTSAFELVFMTSGAFRRCGTLVDPAVAYVTVPGCEQRIEHVTHGDRGIVVLLSERLAAELALDHGMLVRTAAHDGIVARARRGIGEERWLEAMASLTPMRSPAVTDERRRAVQRVRDAIAAEPGGRWSLRDAAAVAGYAPHHLSRVFRRVTGTTLTDHRDRVRLAHAAELAADGMPLADVAAACGFADHGHLTRRAKQVLGVVPSRLRA